MRKLCALLAAVSMFGGVEAQEVDYSVLSVPEESGIDFTQVSNGADYVCMPLVKRSSTGIQWLTNRILAISPDGGSLAYLSARNNTTNIFVKDLAGQGGAMQRTNRSNVLDFTYSPDGKRLCFAEDRGNGYQIFSTDAKLGFICQQITVGNNDYSPVYSTDMKQLYFARQENAGVSIWSYNTANNMLSSYTAGMNPCPMKAEKNENERMLCTRMNAQGEGEIWEIDMRSGTEKCVVSEPGKSFTTPMLSPNGKWILCAGSAKLAAGTSQYYNVDIFVTKTDGSKINQITYHAADDLSPVWSKDGLYIYFISQRGDRNGTANVWRMRFVELNYL